MSVESPTTYALAELLYELGWRSPCDAQWSNLDEAIFDGRIHNAINAELYLRDYIDAEKQRAKP